MLRESEPTGVVIRYLLENPIRAGLVARIEDYPFLGSFEYTRPELIEHVYQSERRCQKIAATESTAIAMRRPGSTPR